MASKPKPGAPDARAKIKESMRDIEKAIQAKSDEAETLIDNARTTKQPVPPKVDKLIEDIAALKEKQKVLGEKLEQILANQDAISDVVNDPDPDSEYLRY